MDMDVDDAFQFPFPISSYMKMSLTGLLAAGREFKLSLWQR